MTAEAGAWHPVGAPSEFPPGKVRSVKVGDRRVAVGRSADGFFALDDTCPHAGASLGEGLLDGDVLVCPLHGFAYHVRTGDCEEDPAHATVFRVREVDDQLEVWLPAAGARLGGAP